MNTKLQKIITRINISSRMLTTEQRDYALRGIDSFESMLEAAKRKEKEIMHKSRKAFMKQSIKGLSGAMHNVIRGPRRYFNAIVRSKPILSHYKEDWVATLGHVLDRGLLGIDPYEDSENSKAVEEYLVSH